MVRKGVFWVYMLTCSDGTYYTGYTNNIDDRIRLHNAGRGAKYTRDRRPVKLAWSKQYRYLIYAMRMEMKIKRLSRKRKDLLVCEEGL